jgi:phospholipase C
MNTAKRIGHAALLLLISLRQPGMLPRRVTLQKVKHIIILMQENHSFDNYFGALAYAPGVPITQAFSVASPKTIVASTT